METDGRALLPLNSGAAIQAFWQAGRTAGSGKELDIAAIRALTSMRDLDAAREILSASEARYPNDFYLTVLRSEISYAAGDLSETFAWAKAACLLDPSHLMTRYRTGVLAIRMREFEVATEHLCAALELGLGQPPDESSVFPLLCLLRIYTVAGPDRAHSIGIWLDRLKERGQSEHIEVSPFLERVAARSEPNTCLSLHLGIIRTDLRSQVLYKGQARHSRSIHAYAIQLQDFDQSHIRLPRAIVSGSFGAVWTDDTCFALDHGFFSSQALDEFDVESKIILTHDTAIAGFSCRERRVQILAERCIDEQDWEVWVIPPCHHANFGHFVHDVLLNKYAFDRIKLQYPSLRPLVLRPFHSAIFQAAFEATFGADYLLVDDPEIAHRVDAAHLLTLPHAMWPDDGAVCVGPARYLRQHLASQQAASRRIFISRTGRDATSERDQQVFEEFGFEPVSLETLSPGQYFSCFADASHIAGRHGAGLTNFVFAPEGVRVAECRRPGGNWHSIAAFAAATATDLRTFEAHTDADALRYDIARWLAESD